MSLTYSTDATFAADVLTSPLPVLVEFTADWCPPCKMIEPILAQIASQEAGRLTVRSLDVDTNPVTVLAYGILSMPTLALFINGEIVVQMVGAKPHSVIMRQLEPHLTPVSSRA